eukprot:14776710-Ditylum_brightwellii.AAC.2
MKEKLTFVQHISVSEVLHVCGLVTLPNHGQVVGSSLAQHVAVNGVVAHVELAACEPGHVALLQRAVKALVERM